MNHSFFPLIAFIRIKNFNKSSTQNTKVESKETGCNVLHTWIKMLESFKLSPQQKIQRCDSLWKIDFMFSNYLFYNFSYKCTINFFYFLFLMFYYFKKNYYKYNKLCHSFPHLTSTLTLHIIRSAALPLIKP